MKHIKSITAILIILSIILVIAFYLRLIIIPFLAAYILQFALRPLVNFLEQKGVKHAIAVSIVFISAFLLFAVLLSFAVPAISSELLNIYDNIEKYSRVIVDKQEDLQAKLLGSSGPLKNFLASSNIEKEIKNERNKIDKLIEEVIK